MRLDEGLTMVIGLIFSLFSIALPIALVVWAVRQFGNRKDSRGMDANSVRRFLHRSLRASTLPIR